MTFLGELNRDIVDTHKNLADLNQTLAMTLQDSKKWNIVSRILSGTGLWSIQNRIRALISVVGEYNRASIAQLENAQKNAELLDKLGSRTKNLEKAAENFNLVVEKGMGSRSLLNMSDLESEEKRLLLLQQQQQVRADAKSITQRTRVKRLQDLDDTTKKLSEHRETMEKLNGIFEERQQLMDNYSIGEEDANKLMKHRLQLMDEAAKKQDIILKGSDKLRAIEGKMLLARAAIDDPSASPDTQRQKRRELGKLKYEMYVQKFLDFSKNILKTAGKVFKFALKSIFIYAPIILLTVFFLYQVTKRAWPLVQEWWSTMDGWLGAIRDWAFDFSKQFGGIREGWNMIKEAWQNGDVGQLLLGVGKILWNVAIIALKAIVATVFTVMWGIGAYLWGAITGGVSDVDGRFAKIGAATGNLLQTVWLLVQYLLFSLVVVGFL